LCSIHIFHKPEEYSLRALVKKLVERSRSSDARSVDSRTTLMKHSFAGTLLFHNVVYIANNYGENAF
jgi:hypothetical protein